MRGSLKMRGSRKKLLAVAAVVGVTLMATFFALRSNDAPQVFRLQTVSIAQTASMKPSAIYHDQQVDAEFEYAGPTLSPPSPHSITRLMFRVGLVRPHPTVRWRTEDIVLLDALGVEVYRQPSIGLTPPATTRPAARMGFVEDRRRGKLIVLWNFDMPPGVDPSTPLTFHTRLGVNDHEPVVIEVAIPPTPSTRDATAAGTAVAEPGAAP
jgi:hypothetical protein